jgi:HK97 family phage major capsid protein
VLCPVTIPPRATPAVALDPAFDPGTGATQLDTIAAAISQLAAQGFVADGIVLSAVDASKIRLLKDSTGGYIWASPDATSGVASMWSVPAIVSPSMAPGSWLVGAFQQSVLLFARQLLVVEISYQDQDDFVRNLATLRAEERIAVGVPVPAGLVTGTFTSAATTGTRTPGKENGKK